MKTWVPSTYAYMEKSNFFLLLKGKRQSPMVPGHPQSTALDWFFCGCDVAIWTVSMEMVKSHLFCFVFECHIILLHQCVQPSLIGLYLMIFVWSLPFCMTLGQYSPIWPSCSVNKRLLFWLNCLHQRNVRLKQKKRNQNSQQLEFHY